MDYRFAMLAALVANLLTDSRKKRWTIEEFMPDFEQALENVASKAEAPPSNVVDKVKAFFGMLAEANKSKPASK